MDFTQSLKKRIKNLYKKTRKDNLVIDENLLNAALRDAAGKLTEEYLGQVEQFLNDATINNFDVFQYRVQDLRIELETYKVVEEPIRSIGFQHNGEEEDQDKG